MSRNALIKFRRDTAANWGAVNPVLAEGEPGYEKGTGKLKVGDGTTAWNSLDYIDGSAPSPPPPSTAGGNVLANGDFSGGATGWADKPPTTGDWATLPWGPGNWTTDDRYGIGQVPELDITGGAANVYMGDRSRTVIATDPQCEAGLVYTGGEWVPALDDWWKIEFDWTQISEHSTNTASPWGIASPQPGDASGGENFYVTFEFGARVDGSPSGGLASPNFGPKGTTTHFTYYHNMVAGPTYGGEFQFVICGYRYGTGDSGDPYGFAFEVDNVSLELLA